MPTQDPLLHYKEKVSNYRRGELMHETVRAEQMCLVKEMFGFSTTTSVTVEFINTTVSIKMFHLLVCFYLFEHCLYVTLAVRLGSLS